jgi:hypothetical protein
MEGFCSGPDFMPAFLCAVLLDKSYDHDALGLLICSDSVLTSETILYIWQHFLVGGTDPL